MKNSENYFLGKLFLAELRRQFYRNCCNPIYG